MCYKVIQVKIDGDFVLTQFKLTRHNFQLASRICHSEKPAYNDVIHFFECVLDLKREWIVRIQPPELRRLLTLSKWALAEHKKSCTESFDGTIDHMIKSINEFLSDREKRKRVPKCRNRLMHEVILNNE